MDTLLASPLMIGICIISISGIVTASFNNRSGCTDRLLIAIRIASYVACRILISSILAGLAIPIPVATASFRITSYNSSLFFSDNFFESLRYRIGWSFGNMTAPATTGPANGPRPTSSIPHIAWWSLYSFSNTLIASVRAISFSSFSCCLRSLSSSRLFMTDHSYLIKRVNTYPCPSQQVFSL